MTPAQQKSVRKAAMMSYLTLIIATTLLTTAAFAHCEDEHSLDIPTHAFTEKACLPNDLILYCEKIHGKGACGNPRQCKLY